MIDVIDDIVASDALIRDIQQIQDIFENLDDQAAEEISTVKQKINKLKQPFFEKRGELFVKIPLFWRNTLMNHPQVLELLTPEDESVLKHVRKIEVQEFEDIKSGFRINFHFEKNDWLKNTVITKEFRFGDSGEPPSTNSKIEWYPNKDLTSNSMKKNDVVKGKQRPFENQASYSFFGWFSENPSFAHDELGEVIKNEIWPNPLQYYLSTDIKVDNEE